jgi:hypothetical protein
LFKPDLRSRASRARRRAATVRAVLAVPVYLGRGAAERPAAVVEAVWLSEAVPFADAFAAVGCALQGAGLLVSFNKSFSFSPAPVRRTRCVASGAPNL